MRYSLWNTDSSRHYHHWGSPQCTQLKWFRNGPYRQHLNPVPLNHFFNIPSSDSRFLMAHKGIQKLTNIQWMDQNLRLDTWPGSVWISKRRISFLKFSQTLRCFIRAPYATFPRTSSSIRPALIMNSKYVSSLSTKIHTPSPPSRDHWSHTNW